MGTPEKVNNRVTVRTTQNALVWMVLWQVLWQSRTLPTLFAALVLGHPSSPQNPWKKRRRARPARTTTTTPQTMGRNENQEDGDNDGGDGPILLNLASEEYAAAVNLNALFQLNQHTSNHHHHHGGDGGSGHCVKVVVRDGNNRGARQAGPRTPGTLHGRTRGARS